MEKEKKKIKKNNQKFKIKSWYSNRYQIVVVQRNILLIFTMLSILAMAVSVSVVKYTVSSKSLEPYLVEVEEKSGIATIVTHSTTETLTKSQAVINYFLNNFVHAASGYDPRRYRMDRQTVRAFANNEVFASYNSRINLKKLGSDSRINVKIQHIRPENPTSWAEVKIQKEQKISGLPAKTTYELITVYFKPERNVILDKEKRLINPLGFQVTTYSIVQQNF